MKKFIRIISIIFVIVIILVIGMYFKVNTASKSAASEISINSIDLSKVESGIYLGSYSKGLVKVKVQVVVKDHRIEEIEILEHENGLGSKAEKIVENVISEQTLEVDTISGATVSSKSILKAVEVALHGSEN